MECVKFEMVSKNYLTNGRRRTQAVTRNKMERRQAAKCADDIVTIMGRSWMKLAQTRGDWHEKERLMLSSGQSRTVDND